MRIYVASSWRNIYQPIVVSALKEDGHEVYDFRGEEGFSWKEVDPQWERWTPSQYLKGLSHACAERGFRRDMAALYECEGLVMVMPCGPSASMEMGWAVGAGRPTAIYCPEIREPDLMVKMAGFITEDFEQIRRMFRGEMISL